ncbi:trypsin-like peptidase domain-containing protein [Myxococcota bacterium]|nr:trypsin-like peptidase domain-containing protein [Myxococcota bacterium]
MKKNLIMILMAAVLSSVLTAGVGYMVVKKTIKAATPRVKTVEVLKRVHGTDNPGRTTYVMTGAAGAGLPDFVPLVEKLKPSVVHIATSTGRGNPYLLKRYHGTRDSGSLGTGIIISTDGLILTNYHVIRGASRIRVTLSDGRKFPAFLKGRDPLTDVALIKIDGVDNLPVATLGNSDKLPIGSWVIAIGNPFGLANTVTAGIVSAKDRTDLNPGKFDYSSYIQTDTAINPGNSGGPLINLRGEVIGINTLVDARGQGIGYAIPVNRIKTIIPHLAKYGKVIRSFLGVRVMDLNSQIIARTKFSGKRGAFIDSVTAGGPAAAGGLMAGDIITEFNTKPIKSEQDIAWEASVAGIGSKVKVVVYRDYKFKTFTVTMTAHPDNQGTVAGPDFGQGGPPFGVLVQDVKTGFKGEVVVVRVNPGSIGEKYGIKRGDRILNVGKTPVRTAKEYYKELKAYAMGQNVMLLIDSPNTTRWVVVPLK